MDESSAAAAPSSEAAAVPDRPNKDDGVKVEEGKEGSKDGDAAAAAPAPAPVPPSWSSEEQQPAPDAAAEKGGAADEGNEGTNGGAAGRIIYGKDVAQESDEIQYKWNAIFYNFTAEQKAKLALDEVSMYSITDTRSANNTSKILQRLVGDRATITDGCAAAGGNTLSFAQHFGRVHAVELDAQRYGLLEHNVAAMGLQAKVRTHQGDFLRLLPQLQQDVVFLDPPWGGKSYTEADTVDLTFGGMDLSEACQRIQPHCRYIALKLPLNFNMDGFSRRLTGCSVVRADDRCARKQLFVVLDTSGKAHPPPPRAHGDGGGRGGGGGGGGRGYKRDRDDREKPWTIKRKT